MGFKELFLATLVPLAKQTKKIKHVFKPVKVVTNPELLEQHNSFIFSRLSPKEQEVKEERKKIRARIKELKKLPYSKENETSIKELRKILYSLG